MSKQHRYSHRNTQRTRRKVASPAEVKFLGGTAVTPHERIILEKGSDELSIRALDLICPIGKGQRGLIVSAAGLGKTTLLKQICNAISKGYSDMKMYCLLIDERPEEVVDFKRSVNATVYASSIDNDQEEHIKLADTVVSKAFEDAAAGEDVIILLDSLTRLARVHNAQHNGRGRTLSGGVDAGAMEVPRRIFGAARDVEEYGSITILATVLVDTNSRMDEVIFEEFKGTGNMELVLSRKLSEKRIFPAIDIFKSDTRRAELLFEPKDYDKLETLYKGMANLNEVDAMEKLRNMLKEYPSNKELLASI